MDPDESRIDPSHPTLRQLEADLWARNRWLYLALEKGALPARRRRPRMLLAAALAAEVVVTGVLAVSVGPVPGAAAGAAVIVSAIIVTVIRADSVRP